MVAEVTTGESGLSVQTNPIDGCVSQIPPWVSHDAQS